MAALFVGLPAGRNDCKMLIEEMCRKTSYTGNGQTKISREGAGHFICGKFKKTKRLVPKR